MLDQAAPPGVMIVPRRAAAPESRPVLIQKDAAQPPQPRIGHAINETLDIGKIVLLPLGQFGVTIEERLLLMLGKRPPLGVFRLRPVFSAIDPFGRQLDELATPELLRLTESGMIVKNPPDQRTPGIGQFHLDEGSAVRGLLFHEGIHLGMHPIGLRRRLQHLLELGQRQPFPIVHIFVAAGIHGVDLSGEGGRRQASG